MTKGDKAAIIKIMDKYTEAWSEEARRLEALIKDKEQSSSSPQYLLNTKTRMIHKILTTFEEMGMEAVTYCKWPYVHKDAKLLHRAPSSRAECCGTCMPALRATFPF